MMSKSLDDLIEFILGQVALCGSQGKFPQAPLNAHAECFQEMLQAIRHGHSSPSLDA